MTEQFRSVRPSPSHAYTGERMSAGHSLETEVEHNHRYYLARQLAAGLDVLDVACGEGYGSAMLAQVARSVVGLDIDADVVRHAAATYGGDRLRFAEGRTTLLPLESASVDLVVSFETLEHFAEHDDFFREAKRILRPGGRLLISTPDRDTYAHEGAEANPFHVLELNRGEFEALISRHFAHGALLSQRAFVGSVLMADRPAEPSLTFDRLDSDRIDVGAGLPRARYYVAICSDAPLDALSDSLFIETSDLTGLTAEIPWLKQEIIERSVIWERERDGLVAERAKSMGELHKVRTELAQIGEGMGREIATLHRTAAELSTRLEASRLRVARLMGLWPRAELHTLRFQLTEARADRAQALAERDSMTALTATGAWRLAQALRFLAERRPREAALAVRAIKALRLLRHGRLKARLALRRQRAADMAALVGHALFDHPWYVAHHLGGQPGIDPVAHYIWIGAALGHNPHPLFDTAWYRAQHPGLGEANPLADYVTRGMQADEDPHPLFDAAYYRSQAPEASGNALLHYLRRQPVDLRCPVRFFDMSAYLADNPQVAAAGQDPVLHYLSTGAAEGRDPHPLFDTDWYRRTQMAGASPMNPLAHWLRRGHAAGLAPHPLFPAAHPDDAALTLPAAESTLDASVIIPVYGRMMDTLRCLHAVARRSGAVRFEVIVADDRPDRPIASLLSWIDGLRTQVNPVNLGFLRNCNAASQLARGRHIVFLNNDTVVQDGWLEALVRLADSSPDVGMVGCKLLNADGTVQEAGGAMLDDGWGRPFGAGEDPARPEYNYVREVDVVIGAAFLVPRAAFRSVGGFDTRYAPAYYEEFDLAFALRDRGLRVLYQPASVVVHLDGSSYGKAERDERSSRNHKAFCRKWEAALGAQPAGGTPWFLLRERARRPVVLMLEDRVPQPDRNAGSVATTLYVELLVSLGLRVIYFPHDGQAPAPYTARLQQAGVEVLHHPVELSDWLARNGQFVDHIWATRPYVTGPRMEELKRFTGAPILYLTHDLHSQRERRRYEIDGDPASVEEADRVEAIERGLFAAADHILSFSQDEACAIRAMEPDASVTVLPLFFYGPGQVKVDPGSFAERRTLLFVGGFNHVPNADAALWLVREIMPALWCTHPDATITIVGPEPPAELLALAGERVLVMGYVADLEPVYAQARVSVSPLRFGSGMKGKIVASLAAGLPVVTTGIGNEGIQLRDGVEALIGDTTEAIAAHLASLLDDDERCRALAKAGAAMVAERFNRGLAEQRVRALLSLPTSP